MNLSITNGTPQQQQWVNDAIQQCSYPLDKLGVTVTVEIVPVLPVSSDIGHAHSYMVTAFDGKGGFVISIADWADDPTNPNNKGLANPSADIYEFFKESFVHELGHVTHFTLITTNAQRTKAAALFNQPDNTGGSGVVFGSLADWSVQVWGDNIMEAIAEVYKCSFFQGTLLFSNRSNWDISSTNFSVLMELLSQNTGVIWDDSFTDPNDAVNYNITFGDMIIQDNTMFVSSISEFNVASAGISIYGGYVTARVDGSGGGIAIAMSNASNGSDCLLVQYDGIDVYASALGSTASAACPVPSGPYWVVARWDLVANVLSAEIWNSDPGIGTDDRSLVKAQVPLSEPLQEAVTVQFLTTSGIVWQEVRIVTALLAPLGSPLDLGLLTETNGAVTANTYPEYGEAAVWGLDLTPLIGPALAVGLVPQILLHQTGDYPSIASPNGDAGIFGYTAEVDPVAGFSLAYPLGNIGVFPGAVEIPGLLVQISDSSVINVSVDNLLSTPPLIIPPGLIDLWVLQLLGLDMIATTTEGFAGFPAYAGTFLGSYSYDAQVLFWIPASAIVVDPPYPFGDFSIGADPATGGSVRSIR